MTTQFPFLTHWSKKTQKDASLQVFTENHIWNVEPRNFLTKRAALFRRIVRRISLECTVYLFIMAFYLLTFSNQLRDVKNLLRQEPIKCSGITSKHIAILVGHL